MSEEKTVDLGKVSGESAYEAAKNGGYTGTQAEFNALLAGLQASLDSKAPGGYGLGGASKYLTADDDLDTVWENGFYSWDAAPKNAPVNYGSMLSINKSSSYISHQLLFAADGSKLQRTRYGETIKQWKWIDPSMMAGATYLTDKYFLGKSVYTKVVSCGYMANRKTVEIVSDAFRILDVRLKGNPDLFPLVPKDSVLTGWQGGFYAGGKSITLYAGDNLVAANHDVSAIVEFIDA